MSDAELEIRVPDAPRGAEVVGVDPGDDLDDTTFATIREALHNHRGSSSVARPGPRRSSSVSRSVSAP